MSDPTQSSGGSSSVTLEDIEKQPQGPNYDEVKLEGENIPELLRGKTITEAVKQFGSLEEAVRMSEQARKNAELLAESLARGEGRTPQPQPQPVVEEPELTDDQIREIMEEDQLKGMEALNARAIRRAEKNLEARLGPLYTGTYAQVEAAARTKYAEEFELFGADISKMAQTIPNSRAVLSNPAAWDDLISLIRGRPGNFDKIIERRIQKANGSSLEQVRTAEMAGVGFSDNTGPKGRPTVVNGQLDAIQREIADKLDMSPEEYIKWSKVS